MSDVYWKLVNSQQPWKEGVRLVPPFSVMPPRKGKHDLKFKFEELLEQKRKEFAPYAASRLNSTFAFPAREMAFNSDNGFSGDKVLLGLVPEECGLTESEGKIVILDYNLYSDLFFAYAFPLDPFNYFIYADNKVPLAIRRGEEFPLTAEEKKAQKKRAEAFLAEGLDRYWKYEQSGRLSYLEEAVIPFQCNIVSVEEVVIK